MRVEKLLLVLPCYNFPIFSKYVIPRIQSGLLSLNLFLINHILFYQIDRVPEELWMEVHNIVQETMIKIKKKKCKKAKWLSEEALQIAMKRRQVKSIVEKERYTHLSAKFQRIARRHKEVFLGNQCKEIEENNRMGKIRDLFKKIRDTKIMPIFASFHATMGTIKDRKGMDLTETEDI